MHTQRKTRWGWEILLFLSALAMTRELALRGDYLPQAIRLAVAVAAAGGVTFGGRLATRVLEELRPQHLLLAVPGALLSGANACLGFQAAYGPWLLERAQALLGPERAELGAAGAALALGTMALPAISFCWLWLIQRLLPILARGWQGLSLQERWYWAVSVAVLAVCITQVYGRTSAFYFPVTQEGAFEGYDVIFNSDTGSQIATGIHLNIGANQSDIRQPLYGLFAQPVGVLGAALGRLLAPVLPDATAIVLAVAQAAALQFVLLLVCRMALPKGRPWVRLALMLAMDCSYPVLLFVLNMEQYVLSLFWLLLLVYVAVEGGSQRERALFYIAATGSLLTTGVLLPLLSGARTVRGWLRDLWSTVGQALAIGGLFARFSLLFAGPTSLIYLLQNFSGAGLPLSQRLQQYSRFLSSCMLNPGGVVDPIFRGWPSYQPMPMEGWDLLGLGLLAVTCVCFWRVRRLPLAKICMGWVAYSVVILGTIGWGSTENGMVLYILYFSWAFFALLAMALDTLLPRIQGWIWSAAAVLLAAWNLPGIGDMIRFGIEYYPKG